MSKITLISLKSILSFIERIKSLVHSGHLPFKSKKAPLFFGINLGKDVSYSGIYSPRNNTLLGFSFGVKNLILRTNANYVNRDLFEAHNYIIGGRDRRTLPLSGFDITVLFVRHLLNNKILHPMIGFTYRKSVIYGGWRNEILISSYGNNIPVARVVNFNDKSFF